MKAVEWRTRVRKLQQDIVSSPAATRARLRAFVLLGDLTTACVVLLCLGAIVVGVVLAFGLLAPGGRSSSKGFGFSIFLIVAGAGFLVSLAASWWAARKLRSELRVTRDNAPALIEMVADVAAALRVRAPSSIWLVDGMGCELLAKPRPVPFTGRSPALIVGASAMHVLSAEQFRAYLAMQLSRQLLPEFSLVAAADAQATFMEQAATPSLARVITMLTMGRVATWFRDRDNAWVAAYAYRNASTCDAHAARVTSVAAAQGALLRTTALGNLEQKLYEAQMRQATQDSTVDGSAIARRVDSQLLLGGNEAAKALAFAWNAARSEFGEDTLPDRYAAIASGKRSLGVPILPPGGSVRTQLLSSELREEHNVCRDARIEAQLAESRPCYVNSRARFMELGELPEGVRAADVGGVANPKIVREWLAAMEETDFDADQSLAYARRAAAACPADREILAVHATWALRADDPQAMAAVTAIPAGTSPLTELMEALSEYHSRHGDHQRAAQVADERAEALDRLAEIEKALAEPPRPEAIEPAEVPASVMPAIERAVGQHTKVKRAWIALYFLEQAPDVRRHILMIETTKAWLTSKSDANEICQEVAEMLQSTPGSDVALVISHGHATRKLRNAIKETGSTLSLEHHATDDT